MPNGTEAKLEPTEQQAYDDRRLIDQCLADEEGAWDQLYDQFHDALLRMIRALIGADTPGELADEIAARVWYLLVQDDRRHLARFDPAMGRPFASYLAALARREISRYFRTERRLRLREQHAGEARKHTANESLNAQMLMAEFTKTLTPKEREFLETSLLGSEPNSDRPTVSDANRWQLSHRVRRKLKSFLKDGREDPPLT